MFFAPPTLMEITKVTQTLFCWVLMLVLSQGEMLHLELALVCCQQFLNLWCHLALPFGWYQPDIIQPGIWFCSVEDETWATSTKPQTSQDSDFQSRLLFLGRNLHFSPNLFKLSICLCENKEYSYVKVSLEFHMNFQICFMQTKGCSVWWLAPFLLIFITPTTNFNVKVNIALRWLPSLCDLSIPNPHSQLPQLLRTPLWLRNSRMAG